MVGVLALVISLGACKNNTTNGERSGAESGISAIGNENIDQSADIIEKYWRLTSIDGEAVPINGMGREAHIIFKSEANRVIGNGGCNTFSGQYELKIGNEVSITKVASTMMACPDMEIEGKLFRAFETFDHYVIVADTLTLTGKGSSAKFEAVYLQ